MFTLGITSDGYLSKQKKTLAIASNGYLDYLALPTPIKGRGGDSGHAGRNVIEHQKPIAEYLHRQRRIYNEDDEILNILKMFLQCQN
jgi:hypothetical protein